MGYIIIKNIQVSDADTGNLIPAGTANLVRFKNQLYDFFQYERAIYEAIQEYCGINPFQLQVIVVK